MGRTMSPHSATPASNIDQSAPSNPRKPTFASRTHDHDVARGLVYSVFGIDSLTPAWLFLLSLVFVLFAVQNY
jgi:hypothetical protein